MVKTIIGAFPGTKRTIVSDGSAILNISECFSNTVQGENFSGYPSVFLRLQHCSLNCNYCDTTEVWRKGNPYTILELLELWGEAGVILQLVQGHHLVVTGGSPLLQQESLLELFTRLEKSVNWNDDIFIEIENEAVLMPQKLLNNFVNQWNNSPKLSNSGMKKELRYKPEVIRYLGTLRNSVFKFVISKEEEDWKEIEDDFLKPELIRRNQIVLMPEGSTRKELQERYISLVDLCCREGVRMCDRLQVTIFDKVVGC